MIRIEITREELKNASPIIPNAPDSNEQDGIPATANAYSMPCIAESTNTADNVDVLSGKGGEKVIKCVISKANLIKKAII